MGRAPRCAWMRCVRPKRVYGYTSFMFSLLLLPCLFLTSSSVAVPLSRGASRSQDIEPSVFLLALVDAELRAVASAVASRKEPSGSHRAPGARAPPSLPPRTPPSRPPPRRPLTPPSDGEYVGSEVYRAHLSRDSAKHGGVRGRGDSSPAADAAEQAAAATAEAALVRAEAAAARAVAGAEAAITGRAAPSAAPGAASSAASSGAQSGAAVLVGETTTSAPPVDPRPEMQTVGPDAPPTPEGPAARSRPPSKTQIQPHVVRSPGAVPGHRSAPIRNADGLVTGERNTGGAGAPQLATLRGDGSAAARLSIQMLRLDSLHTGASTQVSTGDHPVYGGSHRWLFSPQLLLSAHLETLTPLPPLAPHSGNNVAEPRHAQAAASRVPMAARPRSAPSAMRGAGGGTHSSQQLSAASQQWRDMQTSAPSAVAVDAAAQPSPPRTRPTLYERGKPGAGTGLMEDQVAALYAIYELHVREQQQAARGLGSPLVRPSPAPVSWHSAETALAAWHALRDLVVEANRHVSECVQAGYVRSWRAQPHPHRTCAAQRPAAHHSRPSLKPWRARMCLPPPGLASLISHLSYLTACVLSSELSGSLVAATG